MQKKWNRVIALALTALLLASAVAGCGNAPANDSNGPDAPATATLPPLDESEKVAAAWRDAYAGTDFPDADAVSRAELYADGLAVDALSENGAGEDRKYLFRGDASTRAVNVADGYAMTLPGNQEVACDFSLGAFRSQYSDGDYILTVSRESAGFYGRSAESWRQYIDEFVLPTVNHARYLRLNGLEYTRDPIESEIMLDGYLVFLYSIYIMDRENIERPYYNIAVIRQNDVFDTFYLLVCKSQGDRTGDFDALVRSFSAIAPEGIAKNYETAYAFTMPENWNEATRNYFDKLQNQTHVDWGFFAGSMIAENVPYYGERDDELRQNHTRLQELFDTTFEIMPTYTPLMHAGGYRDMPLTMMHNYAGGNGFNGKPVLQMTYHFSASLSSSLLGHTPMFDIIDGYHDEQLRKVARDLKSYGHPVLFRLCNEMDGNWVHWNGLATLLDPDIFAMAWTRLYTIFEEEGVDNCIWIFNPNDVSSPEFASWNQWMCYLPDSSMIHMLGLTAYEPGNGFELRSFSSLYRRLYERSTPYFEDFIWIISEFGCGSGGEVRSTWNAENPIEETVAGRNKVEQAEWVRAMFNAMYNTRDSNYYYMKNIKAAVWFSGNDHYTDESGNQFITNYYKITDELTETIEAFKEGLHNRQR